MRRGGGSAGEHRPFDGGWGGAWLAGVAEAFGVPEPVREYRFFPGRRWRFDYAWPDARVALEIEGGVWTGGRHIRPVGFLGDIAKYNTAAVEGWVVLRATPEMLTEQAIWELVRRALQRRPTTPRRNRSRGL